MPVFRLLHVSDFHLCPEPNRKNRLELWSEGRRSFDSLTGHEPSLVSYGLSSYRPLLAEDVVRLAGDPKSQVDAIICTGDLATSGNLGDLESARNYFKNGISNFTGLAAKVSKGLYEIGKPILIMPGNHDRYKDTLGAAGGKSFDFVFNGLWARRGKDRVDHMLVRKGDSRIIVIAADFCLEKDSHAVRIQRLPKKITRMGQGKCYPHVLQTLRQHTKDMREKYVNAHVIWAVHFPPVGVADGKMTLIDGEELVLAARELDVQLAISGHLHKVLHEMLIPGTLLGAGTCCAVNTDEIHRAHILEISLNENTLTGLSRENFSWSLDKKMFVFESRSDMIS
jgi:predicted phosphodiesterase